MSTAPTPFTHESTPFAIRFGMKGLPVEVVRDGVLGLVTDGTAALYNMPDQVGEYHLPGGFRDLVDTWAQHPLVDYDHGFDPVLGGVVIGQGIDWNLDGQGLHVKCFIPKEHQPPFQDNAAIKNKRWAQIYEGIKSGRINGYSIMGPFKNIGKALVQWSMTRLAITPRPCQKEATFALGTEGVKSLLGGLPMMDYSTGPAPMAPPPGGLTEQNTLGVLTRPDYGVVMRIAQKHKARALHDHLLREVPPELSGPHNAEDCPICADRRMSLGVKDEPWAEHGIKAVTKSEGDAGDCQASCYLVVEDPAKPSTWHLRVKDADGTPNPRLMGNAHAALLSPSGYRGNPYEGPNKAEAIAKLKALYAAEGMDWPKESSGQGAKAIEEAQAILAQYTAGVKAGRRFSAASTATITKVIDMLKALIAEEQAEEQEEAPATQ